MLGWIVLGLLVLGGFIFAQSHLNGNKGGAEQRMSDAFQGAFGLALIAIAVLIVLGMGVYNLF